MFRITFQITVMRLGNLNPQRLSYLEKPRVNNAPSYLEPKAAMPPRNTMNIT
jgi:hypothetical protein